MNLPTVISNLVAAQNNFDSQAYSDCFSETAIVHDEGHTHIGKDAIKTWIEKANQAYKASMKPLTYSASEQTLEAEISGTFPGSPLVLTYQMDIQNGQIHSLKIG